MGSQRVRHNLATKPPPPYTAKFTLFSLFKCTAQQCQIHSHCCVSICRIILILWHWNSVPINQQPPILLSPSPWQPPCYFLSLWILHISYKWNHTVFAFLLLAYFTWPDGLKFHPCCSLWYFILCMDHFCMGFPDSSVSKESTCNVGDLGFDPWVFWSRGDPLEKGKAIHSSILAWKIPWTV